MKKSSIIAISASVLFILAGCKAKESTYKAAYEKAQEREIADESIKTPTVVEDDSDASVSIVKETPEVSVTKVEPASDVRVTKERVSTIDNNDATKLMTYNVVLGSFSITTNAIGLKDQLVADGYNAFVAQNANGWYRVIAASFGDRESATAEREKIQARYPDRFKDAWLLINE